VGCGNDAEVGAHVYDLRARGGTKFNHFIVPLCKPCNANRDDFKIDGSVPLVPANKERMACSARRQIDARFRSRRDGAEEVPWAPDSSRKPGKGSVWPLILHLILVVGILAADVIAHNSGQGAGPQQAQGGPEVPH